MLAIARQNNMNDTELDMNRLSTEPQKKENLGTTDKFWKLTLRIGRKERS